MPPVFRRRSLDTYHPYPATTRFRGPLAPLSPSHLTNRAGNARPARSLPMNTNAVIDLTNEDDISPIEIPLKLGRDGYSVKTDNFRVLDNVIGIKVSDADSRIVPNEQQRRRTYDQHGKVSQHVQIDNLDATFQHWMDVIGPYLADWVLELDKDTKVPWRLLKFPDGYSLWVHLKADQNDPANPRKDAYLYGASSKRRDGTLGPVIFRSPREFVGHAIWLMHGKRGQCMCKYCTPGQTQIQINRRLNRRREEDEDEDEDRDEDQEGGGSRAARSTRGARGAHVGNDESRPVRAKDYRTFPEGQGPYGA
ncbi:hypothetical protein BC834DRAFT_877116 [Gloeopeniophorella convolvens]|nr:hypothetical protein BC834DRAFT_877116 [Gloeopeniophorella convolvens]